ncbi:DarT ssDNA thymidine ADP-ribosyltransferase family protein [Stenotrophomonas maltophilia]
MEWLLHFTPIPNLASIVELGLLCRSRLQESQQTFYTSSEHRLDDNQDAISVSVSAINHFMFLDKRKASRRSDWVVLLLSSSILWTHECRFNARNAAKKEMYDRRSFVRGLWAFEAMFQDKSSQPGYRSEHDLPLCLTTYPDAEVQVMDPISASLISGAWVSDAKFEPLIKTELDRLNQRDGKQRKILVHDFVPRLRVGNAAWG